MPTTLSKTLRIRTVEHLAKQLRCSRSELEKYAAHPEHYYRKGEFTDKKGKRRPKSVAQPRLKEILSNLNKLLQRLDLPPALHGSRRRHSYITNAAEHVGKEMVLNADIRSFFPSITTKMVRIAFRHQLQCSPKVATLISVITTPEGVLPQGPPHSPMVANIVLLPLVRRLEGLARQHGATYTQYVDDITLSGPVRVAGLRNLVCRIVKQQGFSCATEKVHRLSRRGEQVVTGVRVNDGLDVPRATLKSTQALLLGDHSGISSSLEGKIAAIKRLNPGVGRNLQRTLRKSTVVNSKYGG